MNVIPRSLLLPSSFAAVGKGVRKWEGVISLGRFAFYLLSTRRLLRARSNERLSLPPLSLPRLHFSLIRPLDHHQPLISSRHSVITGWSLGKTLLSVRRLLRDESLSAAD